MKNSLIIIAACIFLISCNSGEPKVIIEPVQKNEAVMGDTVKHVAEQKMDTVKTEVIPAIDYTGKYKLYVTRFKVFTIKHSLELVQVGDSVRGFYSITYSNTDKSKIANYKGEVSGLMAQTRDDVNSGTNFIINITEVNLDSANYKANEHAAYMIDKFLNGLMLTTRFSIKNNTIENNYAGGEWDTWTRTE